MVSHYRGTPPLDNANTLYIEVSEEVSGTLAMPIRVSSPLNKRPVSDVVGYGEECLEVFIFN